MRPVSIPNTFQTKTGQIPLSQLDSNFTTLATAINDVNTGNAYYVDSSGTPNQIVVTTPSNVTATYQTGLTISVQVGNTNTATAVTINVNGQGATNLANVSGTTGVAIGQITALDIVDLVFDGTSFIVTGGSGLATSTMAMSLAGNFTIPAPTSGNTLTVNSVAGGSGLISVGAAGTAGSIEIRDGNTGNRTFFFRVGQISVGVFDIYDNTAAASRLQIPIAGGLTVGQPSGGSALNLSATNAVSQISSIVVGGGTPYIPWVNIGPNFFTTGSATATLTANKPGSNASVQGWMVVSLNGTQGYVPVWS